MHLVSPLLIQETRRTAALIGQIPWIGRYKKILPGLGMEYQRFRAFAMERFGLRKSEGSKKKDLFYHLVRK